MSGVGASVGLVVSREMIRILEETYQGHPSIQLVGEFPVSLARGLRTSTDPVDFADDVQRWLELLRAGEDGAVEPLRSVLAVHVSPALADGTVRAAGPRTRVAVG
jgi:hypothetical protein